MSRATPGPEEIIAEMREALAEAERFIAERRLLDEIDRMAEPVVTVPWHGDVYEVPENVLRRYLVREVTDDE